MGGGLKRIAMNGEVYGFKFHPYFVQKNHGRVIPEKIGLRKASTFLGFCQTHDRETFAPAETSKFTASANQLFLLNFRAIARRVYSREISLRHTHRMFQYDRGLPSNVQRIWFVLQEGERLRAEESLANIRALKALYDARLLAEDFTGINALVSYFYGPPEVALTEIVGIDADFNGAVLTHPPPPAHMIVYTIGTDDGWALIFSWLGANEAAEAICRSFAARADHEKPSLFLRYAMEYIDNMYFAPAWWEAIPAAERAEVIEALTSRMHPLYARHPAVLAAANFVSTGAKFAGSLGVGPWISAAA
jgi:hypothetical protein